MNDRFGRCQAQAPLPVSPRVLSDRLVAPVHVCTAGAPPVVCPAHVDQSCCGLVPVVINTNQMFTGPPIIDGDVLHAFGGAVTGPPVYFFPQISHAPAVGYVYCQGAQECVQGQTQVVAKRKQVPWPAVSVPNPKLHEMTESDPTFFRDECLGDYGIRCVCGESELGGGLIVRCEICEYWLHGACVGIARDSQNASFFCPFCLQQKIGCMCGETQKYDEQLVQCQECKLWMHKSCEGLGYGRIPSSFACRKCSQGVSRVYDIRPHLRNVSVIPDLEIIIDRDRWDIVSSIPEGGLKTMIAGDLSHATLNFRETLIRYFCAFAELLFARGHEFWRSFSDSLEKLLSCQRHELLDAVDQLASTFIYAPPPIRLFEQTDAFMFSEHSESVARLMEKMTVLRFDQLPADIPLTSRKEGGVQTTLPLDDGDFIRTLPGFLERDDSVKCDNGIPRSCLAVTNSRIVVDLAGTSCSLAAEIRRSFHFNCIVQLVKCEGNTTAALFATRTKGPLGDKSRRGAAIVQGGELLLPFDGDIPFSVERIEWKEKKQRGRPPRKY